MREEDIALLADTTYTLHRCSPLFRFVATKREYLHLERLVAKAICDQLDLCVEGQEVDPNLPRPSGKIYVLKFRPFEFEGFEHDNTYREQPVIKFELEYHFYGKKRDRAQHMIMFPAKTIPPANTSSKEFWFYPLILSKLTAPVLNIVARVFERHFHAYISPLQVAPSLLESVVQYYAMSSCEPLLNDDMYIGDIRKSVRTEPMLRLEYIGEGPEINTIKLSIRPNQVIKMCSLGSGPEEFYTMFRSHIRNSTKINLGAFLLNSVSCSIVSLSKEDKLKIPRASPKPYVFRVLEDLILLASKGQ